MAITSSIAPAKTCLLGGLHGLPRCRIEVLDWIPRAGRLGMWPLSEPQCQMPLYKLTMPAMFSCNWDWVCVVCVYLEEVASVEGSETMWNCLFNLALNQCTSWGWNLAKPLRADPVLQGSTANSPTLLRVQFIPNGVFSFKKIARSARASCLGWHDIMRPYCQHNSILDSELHLLISVVYLLYICCMNLYESQHLPDLFEFRQFKCDTMRLVCLLGGDLA